MSMPKKLIMMTCGKCIYWDITSLECRNKKVEELIDLDCDDGYVQILIKFKPEFGCIYFDDGID